MELSDLDKLTKAVERLADEQAKVAEEYALLRIVHQERLVWDKENFWPNYHSDRNISNESCLAIAENNRAQAEELKQRLERNRAMDARLASVGDQVANAMEKATKDGG